MLLGKIRTDDEHGLGRIQIGRSRECAILPGKRIEKRTEIARAVVIDVLCPQTLACELL